jgi:hypothetical protein
MKIGRIIEAGIGLYLILPSWEDVISGGTTLIPSAALGLYLLNDAIKHKNKSIL